MKNIIVVTREVYLYVPPGQIIQIIYRKSIVIFVKLNNGKIKYEGDFLNINGNVLDLLSWQLW